MVGLAEAAIADFRKVAAGIGFEKPRIGMVSSLTGGLMTGVPDPGYWARQALETVRFQAGMETLKQEGCGIFIEVGPGPGLLEMGRACLPEGYGSWLPSLRSGQNDWKQMIQSLGDLYMKGITPDWRGLNREGNKVALPTYPFQRQRYWVEGLGIKQAGVPAGRRTPGRRLIQSRRICRIPCWDNGCPRPTGTLFSSR